MRIGNTKREKFVEKTLLPRTCEEAARTDKKTSKCRSHWNDPSSAAGQ